MNPAAPNSHPKARHFSAVLRPYRSLSPRGFAVVMGAVAAIGFGAGMVFLLLGAWPVFGFLGLDVALVYWALTRSYADARMVETIEIDAETLIVRRLVHGRPVVEWRLEPYWIRVELEEDETLETCGPLLLRSHGRALEIGSFLAPGDKRSLAAALRGALAR